MWFILATNAASADFCVLKYGDNVKKLNISSFYIIRDTITVNITNIENFNLPFNVIYEGSIDQENPSLKLQFDNYYIESIMRTENKIAVVFKYKWKK